jgi:hypothetical protein
MWLLKTKLSEGRSPFRGHGSVLKTPENIIAEMDVWMQSSKLHF